MLSITDRSKEVILYVMVSQCCMLLCPCIYGLQQCGHLNKNCSLCFLFCSVLSYKIEENGKKTDVLAAFN